MNVEYKVWTRNCLCLALPVLFSILAIAAAHHRWGSTLYGAPKLVGPTDTLTLEQVSPNRELLATVPIRNGGGGTLRIERLETGCGCARVAVSPRELRAEEEALIQLAIRTKDESQHLMIPVRVYSNDPANPIAEFRVQVEPVAPAIKWDPDKVDFGQLSIGTTMTKRVRLFKADGQAWPQKVDVSATAARGIIDVVVVSQPDPKNQDAVVLELKLRSALPVGEFEDEVLIQRGDGSRLCKIPVYVNVVPRWVVSPSTLYFEVAPGDKDPVQRTVLVRRTDGKPMRRLARFTASFDVDIQHQGASQEAVKRLCVSLKAGQVIKDANEGKLHLWFEGETEPLTATLLLSVKQP